MSIFSNNMPEAHVNHNPFDNSKRDVFSIKPCMLTPVSVVHTIPNSVYDLSVMNKIEPNGMPVANFARMSQNIDYFFVPYSQLWHYFEPMYYQRLDPVRNPTNTMNPSLPSQVPVFNLGRVVTGLFTGFAALRLAYAWSEWWEKITDDENRLDPSQMFELFVYQECKREFPEMFDRHNRFCPEDMLRNLDMLGYGNYLPFFLDVYKVTLWEIVHSHALEGDIDVPSGKYLPEPPTFGELSTYFSGDTTTQHDYYRKVIDDNWPLVESMLPDLWSFLFNGHATDVSYYWNFFDNDFVTSAYLDIFVDRIHYYPNAWSILSYLKIFSDYYRSVQYDNENYAYYYNVDNIVSPDTSSNLIPYEKIMKCLLPQYHLYKRDIFTGGYPSAQFGDVAVSTLEPKSFKLESGSRQVGVDSSGNVKLSGSGTASTSVSFKTNPLLGVTALAVRMAEQMQKWKEKNLRAGNRLTNQQNAMFGDRSRYLEDSYVREIGNTFSPVIINDVVATADSQGGLLVGEKGSSAISNINSDVVRRFESHDFGVIIGIMYILPESEYESFGLAPHNMLTEPFDYPNPLFQNLGLEGVSSLCFNIFQDETIKNYLSRYWQYKAELSRVHGEFNQTSGAFRAYVSPRDVQMINDNTLAALYGNPNDVDSLFYTDSNEFQSSDQFKVDMHVTIKALLPLSVTGLPV